VYYALKTSAGTDTMDIGGWLRGLRLERYEQAFRENEIDADVLPSLTVEDLKDLGVTLVGDRRRLLDAIAALGKKLTQEPQAEPSEGIGRLLAPTSGTAGTEAERRQLTVMFCDLVGSTPLSVRFDPEDLREIVGGYHRCVADTVARFARFVAKYMGDGVLSTSATPRRMRTTPSARCAPGWRSSTRSAGSPHPSR
jgi:hypothetical protein